MTLLSFDSLIRFILGKIKCSIRLNPNILMQISQIKQKLYHFSKTILYAITEYEIHINLNIFYSQIPQNNNIFACLAILYQT